LHKVFMKPKSNLQEQMPDQPTINDWPSCSSIWCWRLKGEYEGRNQDNKHISVLTLTFRTYSAKKGCQEKITNQTAINVL
jgi:hypothetical protein